MQIQMQGQGQRQRQKQKQKSVCGRRSFPASIYGDCLTGAAEVMRRLGVRAGAGVVVVVVALALCCRPVFAGTEEHGSPEGMALIPGGEFIMGFAGEGDHSPQHAVRVDTFWIDTHEVTNAEYYTFCVETERKLPEFWGTDTFRSGPGYPDHPVTGVSWYDAHDYAEWCGKRLPTEAEWEYAARGGLVGNSYPNADTLKPEDANYTKSEQGGTLPVGSYPANGYGLYDMAGNVVEWVGDWYQEDYYGASPVQNPEGPEKGKFRVIRGGGWHSGPGCVRVYFRNGLPANWLDFNVGFRCARDFRRAAD